MNARRLQLIRFAHAKRWAGRGWTAEMIAAVAAEPNDKKLAWRLDK